MNITADIRAFTELVQAARDGKVPAAIPDDNDPAVLAFNAEGKRAVWTREPRRVILDTWQELEAAWKLRETPAQMGVVERCVEHLTALQSWYEGEHVE